MGAGHLGQGAAGGAHERGAARHGLDGGEREAFVERWHTGQFGFAVELDDALVGDAADEVHAVVETEGGHRLAGVGIRAALADDREFHVALGAKLGDRLEQELQALHRDVGRCRGDDVARAALDAGDRQEEVGVDADGDDVDLVEIDALVGGDVLLGVL